jgi:prepilin-type N-terminal cleavage/methylation domain-containing protein
VKNSKGFTLIELLIVVVIIGILAAIAIPKFANTKEKAYIAAMKSDLRNLVTAEESYFADNVTYTSNLGTNYNSSPGNGTSGACPLESFSLTTWCEENGLLGRATSRALKRCGDGVRPPGEHPALPSGRPGSGGFGRRVCPRRPSHFRSDHSGRTPLSSGETEDRSWWKTSRELAGPARGPPVRVHARSLEHLCLTSPRSGGQSAGGTGPGSRVRVTRGPLWRGTKLP